MRCVTAADAVKPSNLEDYLLESESELSSLSEELSSDDDYYPAEEIESDIDQDIVVESEYVHEHDVDC